MLLIWSLDKIGKQWSPNAYGHCLHGVRPAPGVIIPGGRPGSFSCQGLQIECMAGGDQLCHERPLWESFCDPQSVYSVFPSKYGKSRTCNHVW